MPQLPQLRRLLCLPPLHRLDLGLHLRLDLGLGSYLKSEGLGFFGEVTFFTFLLFEYSLLLRQLLLGLGIRRLQL